MRIFSALIVLGLGASACTPNIPVVPEFGVSALKATGGIPPEFAAFNRYDPRVNPLLVEQMCATMDEQEVVKALEAVPGEIPAAQAKCLRYQPFFARVLGEIPTQ